MTQSADHMLQKMREACPEIQREILEALRKLPEWSQLLQNGVDYVYHLHEDADKLRRLAANKEELAHKAAVETMELVHENWTLEEIKKVFPRYFTTPTGRGY